MKNKSSRHPHRRNGPDRRWSISTVLTLAIAGLTPTTGNAYTAAGDRNFPATLILPQVGPLLMANTVLTVAVAIYLETALAFLGLEDPTTTTWGTILQAAFNRAAVSAGAWWAIVPDGIAITLLIMGCFLLGQAIEDALNPRLKVAHLSARRWSLRPLAGRGPGAI